MIDIKKFLLTSALYLSLAGTALPVADAMEGARENNDATRGDVRVSGTQGDASSRRDSSGEA